MAQYAVLIYAADSAHAPAAAPDDLQECDDHAADLLAENSIIAAYALTPRAMARPVHSGGQIRPASGSGA